MIKIKFFIFLIIFVSKTTLIFSETSIREKTDNSLLNSSNWSGYVAATNINDPKNHSVSKVSGSWKVPALDTTKNSSLTIWIGIDGYKGKTIEQIGTLHRVVNGKQINSAWFSMHPNESFLVSNFHMSSNDSISASVKYNGNNQFTLIIKNDTRGQMTEISQLFTKSPDALRNSAQWIVESSDANFAKFNKINFSDCNAVIDNRNKVGTNTLSKSGIAMLLKSNVDSQSIDPQNATLYKNKTRALPSTFSDSDKSFFVKWFHY